MTLVTFFTNLNFKNQMKEKDGFWKKYLIDIELLSTFLHSIKLIDQAELVHKTLREVINNLDIPVYRNTRYERFMILLNGDLNN